MQICRALVGANIDIWMSEREPMRQDHRDKVRNIGRDPIMLGLQGSMKCFYIDFLGDMEFF